jgi:hypothetical protein
VTLVISLVAASAGLFVLGSGQTPQLNNVEVDAVLVTERAGQQVRFVADRPLNEVASHQVTVTPNARVSLSVEADVLVVALDERLRYGTEYLIEVRGVSALDSNSTVTFAHRFTTGQASFVYLDRGEDYDEVLRTSLTETSRGDLVYRAEGIQHIAPLDDQLVVARHVPGGTSLLEAIALDGSVRTLTLPPNVRIDRFVVPSSGHMLAMTLTSVEIASNSAALSNALAVVDVAGDGTVRVVLGPDGTPISTITAAFVPDVATVIAHAIDSTLYRVELFSPPLVLPITQIPMMYALSTDGTRVTGSDSVGGLVVNLASTETTRLEASLVDNELVASDQAALTGTNLRVERVTLGATGTDALSQALLTDNGSGFGRVLLRTDDVRSAIGSFVISPNDQFVAVEVAPSVEDADLDRRVVDGRPTSATTIIIDIQSGEIMRTLQGISAIW